MHKDISLLWDHDASHESVFRVIKIYAIVMFGANLMRTIMLCVQTTV